MRLRSVKVPRDKCSVDLSMRGVLILAVFAFGYCLASSAGIAAIADHAPQLRYAEGPPKAPYDEPGHPPPKPQPYDHEPPHYPDHPDDTDPLFSSYTILIVLIAALAFWLGYLVGRGQAQTPSGPTKKMVIDAINGAFDTTLANARAILAGATLTQVEMVVNLARTNVLDAINKLKWP